MGVRRSLTRPRALRPGDRIAIVAPASPPNRDQVLRGVAELESWGFEVSLDDRVFAVDRYLAGDAASRAAHLQEAFADPAIAGIVCVRGGYGSVQLLPHLDLARIAATPKVFVGYSDVTTLLNVFTLQGGFVTFHGPMLEGRFGGEPGRYDRDSFAKAVSAAEPMGALVPPGLEVMRAGEATGMLVGGTLMMLAASLGTPWAFDPPDGHILFVDEVNERPYRIDRLFEQLRQAGVLRRTAGIVVNELPGCDEPNGSLPAIGALRAILADFPGPIVTGFPSGHTPGATVTLPIGVTASLLATRRPALVIEEAAVTG